MAQPIPVTPELERTYAGTNCWDMTTARFGSGIPCAAYGPQGGQCTLRAGHGGLIHIAHQFALSSPNNHTTIYTAWMDGDPDMEVDEGL